MRWGNLAWWTWLLLFGSLLVASSGSAQREPAPRSAIVYQDPG